jgi:hypothetical protein
MYFRRTTKSPSTIRGVDIPDGSFVCVYYPSANRDEDVFPDPDRSTSRGTRTSTSRSATASTSAWARASRGSSSGR